MGEMVSTSRFVFVGGLHRSGTTPLARELADHPDISGLTGTGVPEDEGQHLQDVYPRLRAHGGMGRFALSPRAHLTAEDVRPDTRERLLSAWTPYWNLDAPLLLEKSPANLIMGRYLQAAFPESALVVVIRHPVVTALALQKWNPTIIARNGRRRATMSTMIANWVRAHDLLAADAEHLSRLHVLRYEDLVADPAGQLAPVGTLLALSRPPTGASIKGGHNDRYAEEWRAMARGRPWQRMAHRRVLAEHSDAVARWGYSLEDPAVTRSWSWSSATQEGGLAG